MSLTTITPASLRRSEPGMMHCPQRARRLGVLASRSSSYVAWPLHCQSAIARRARRTRGTNGGHGILGVPPGARDRDHACVRACVRTQCSAAVCSPSPFTYAVSGGRCGDELGGVEWSTRWAACARQDAGRAWQMRASCARPVSCRPGGPAGMVTVQLAVARSPSSVCHASLRRRHGTRGSWLRTY